MLHFTKQVVGAFITAVGMGAARDAIEDAFIVSVVGKYVKPGWRKPENQESPTIQQLRYVFYTAAFVAIQLHDVLLAHRLQHGKQAWEIEMTFLQNNVDLITPTIWFNITPGLRLVYLLIPRLIAFYT